LSIELQPLNPPEKSRTYTFPGGDVLSFQDVTHFLARLTSGTHRLKTADGKMHIVASGWLSITMDVESFTV
jgi:hypothetical protein